MTLRHMQIFVAVCDCKSVTGAAQRLMIAQPTVSLGIRELEEYYGVRLFDRIARKLYLTEAGKQFLGYARHITSLFSDLERELQDQGSKGLLRIGSSITVGTCLMPGYVCRFQKNLPQIQVEVQVDNSRRIEEKVLSNQVDFALIEGIPQSRQLTAHPFLEDKLVFLCGKNHPLAGKKRISREEFLSCAFLLRERGSGTRELFESLLLVQDLSVRPIWESTSTQAILQAVKAGIGVSVLPYRLAERELCQEEICCLEIEGLDFQRRFYIIYHQNKYLPPAALEFLSMILPAFPRE